MSSIIGMKGEDQAKKFLLNQGLSYLVSNFRSKYGEIDLIMQDNNTLVFVEVKLRSSLKYGQARAAIPFYKQQKIIKCANFYLKMHNLYDSLVRFDVIAIQINKVSWIKNAFGSF